MIKVRAKIMSEKLTAKEYAEKLLYTPEYAADKQAD